ncbi:hypothetical protein HK097_001988 [Rhizophlyctis rosea]|uniref:SH3 domain-containing protein n=1 Tax=Rhizophlyctis rosea TaxID=64517 RepID=A0AAD5X6P4_9FUNG|nr:hypothetical protein HK097_001988 [Rhizophlyctis rosea]
MDQKTTIIIATSTGSLTLLLVVTLTIILIRRRRQKQKSRSFVRLEDSSTFATTKGHEAGVRMIQEESEEGGEEGSGDEGEGGEGKGNEHLPSAYQNVEDGLLPSYVAVEDFEPKRRDDMRLRVGDRVTISMTFTDGWCHGYNQTTNAMGMFPISNLAIKPKTTAARRSTTKRSSKGPSTPAATPGGVTSPTTPESATSGSYFPPQPPADQSQKQKGKLLFSMVPVDQALEIVTSSLSASRRAEYFETLLRQTTTTSSHHHRSTSSISTPTTPHSPSPLDSPLSPSILSPETEKGLRASMEGASGSETRGKQAWRKLRVGWRDAVEAELQEGYRKWVEDRERFDIWGFMAESYKT